MSSSFYTHISCHDGHIIHRYINSDGVPVIAKEKAEYDYYLPDPNGDYISLYGRKLSRRTVTNTNDVRKVFKDYKDINVHGYDKADIQFISNTYTDEIWNNFDFTKIKIANIDIETAIGDGFPDVNLTEQEIIAITVQTIGTPNTVTFTSLDYNPALDTEYSPNNRVIVVGNEVELAQQFLNYWFNEKFDAVTGWNVKGFDIPYMVNRFKKVVGDKMVRMLSPIAHIITRGIMPDPNPATGKDEFKIDGISILDYIELYKKYSFKPQPNYKLETIAQDEIGEGKVDYCGYATMKEFYLGNPTMFIRYNIQDVLLVGKMDAKLQYLILSYTLQYLAKCNTNDIFGQVKYWDCLLYNHLKTKGIVTPPSKDNPELPLEGAYVAEPQTGKHKWVVSFDLTSLYPHIIKQFNMSPETIVHNGVDYDLIEQLINLETPARLQQAFEERLAMSANGAMFSKEQKGLFSEVVDKLFNIRKETRAKMKDIQRKVASGELGKEWLEKIPALDAVQMAMKIAINSLYGACGNKGFRYYDHSIAEGITKSGQLAIRYISKRINEHLENLLGAGYRIVYNDTDSVYITLDDFVKLVNADGSKTDDEMLPIVDAFVQAEIEPFIDKCYDELAQHLNAYENAMSMKRETISLAGMWRAKKNYVLLELDNEGVRYKEPKLKAVGVETVRSTTPAFVKEAIKKCYRAMLTSDDPNALVDIIEEFRVTYKQQDYNQISTPRGVNEMEKWVDAGGNYISRIPFNVKASHEYNRLRKEHGLNDIPIITNGSKVNLVEVRANSIVTGGYMAYIDRIPEEFGITQYIDFDGMFEKTFVSPVDSFASLLGMKTNNQFQIDDFFS